MNTTVQTLGVIGGLGPMATAYFMELVTSMTEAATDQEHLRMLICSAPDIPDRTSYILGNSTQSPLPGIVAAGNMLRQMGAGVLAIPCITAHYFHDEVERKVGIRLLHVIAETADLLADAGITAVGLMATDGTVQSGLFRKIFDERHIRVILPSEEMQREVMSLIYDKIKRGVRPEREQFERIRAELRLKGAERILLGCTELSLLKRDYPLTSDVLDLLEVLARSAILSCGKSVRKEYLDLVNPGDRELAVKQVEKIV